MPLIEHDAFGIEAQAALAEPAQLDLIAVPLFGGAMENPGLVTYRQSLILAKPGQESTGFRRAFASVNAHELSHQWFGDLVTTETWDDIWLNEAIATWMTPKIIEKFRPEWDIPTQRAASANGAMRADSLVTARAIRQPITSNDDIKNAFDGITYQKGAATIAMIRTMGRPRRLPAGRATLHARARPPHGKGGRLPRRGVRRGRKGRGEPAPDLPHAARRAESQKYQQENAELQIKQLEGTLVRAQKNVDLWRQTLQNLVVKAPVNGLLSSINVEVGSSISQGQNIGQIDDIHGFKLRADVDEHYIARIFTGLKANTEINGKKYDLNVIKVYPEVHNGRFAIDLTFALSSPVDVRRGQSSIIRIELGQSQKANLLAVGGFLSDTGGNWVYVMETGGQRAVKRNISLGRKNPNYYEVIDGLKPGDKVNTSTYSNYGDKEVLTLGK